MIRVRNTLLSLLLISAFAVASSGSALAVVMLDQVSAPDGGVNLGTSMDIGAGSGTFGRAQTFTVGLAGILDSVEVSMHQNDDNPATLRILATSGGVPIGGAGGSTVLATSSVFTAAGSVFTFDLSASALAIAVGDVLAIEVFGGTWLGNSGTYAGGAAYFFNTLSAINNWTSSADSGLIVDAGFRSFVQVAAVTSVPEPASLALFGAGLAGLGALGWRRRKPRQNADASL